MATTTTRTTTSHYTTSLTSTHSFGLAPGAATTSVPRSPWHSPVPYLFGGLAAMLGLIAFALLILACSYWRLSNDNDESQQNEDDLEKGEGVNKMNNPPVYEEKIVVIMAGNDVPTFLANPVQMFPKQGLVVVPISKDETSTSNAVVEDGEKPKENDENDHDEQQQHN